MELTGKHLRRLPLFAGLSEEALNELAKLVRVRNYKKDMLIFLEGEPGEGLHFVQQGKVKIYKMASDGKEQILHFRQPGDIFAEVTLFDGGPYPASAETIEESQIGIIRNADLYQWLEHHPSLTVQLLKDMAKKLREAQQRLVELVQKDTYGRVASTLLRLAESFGSECAVCKESTVINLYLDRQELANYAGTSRETATRILQDLAKSGIIKLEGKKITILKQKELERWL